MKNTIADYLEINKYKNVSPKSPAELAEMVGVGEDCINEIIEGERIPAVPPAIRIARALNKTVEDVFIVE